MLEGLSDEEKVEILTKKLENARIALVKGLQFVNSTNELVDHNLKAIREIEE